MEALLGFHVGFWDYATFLVLAHRHHQRAPLQGAKANFWIADK